jgi:hypothetical protein
MIAAHSDAYSPRCSVTIRVAARSRGSAGYLTVSLIAPSSHRTSLRLSRDGSG